MRDQRRERQNAGMGTPVNWDFALELSGVTPDDLTLTRLADYLREWSALLGDASKPVFRGVVKGSAVLRAAVPALERVNVSVRVRNAANDGDAARYLTNIEGMLAVDGVKRARIVDRNGAVLSLVLPTRRPAVEEITVHDVATIDGRVVRVEGRDKTAHIGLVESGTGRAISVQTTDDALAQALARHFRGDWVRVHTEGTWVRHPDGQWEPKSLTALHFEQLDDTPGHEVLRELANLPGNGWARMPVSEALAEWRELRGIDDQDEKLPGG